MIVCICKGKDKGICLESRCTCDYTCSSDGVQQLATIDLTLDLCTRYPLRLGGPRQCGIQSLPDTSTYSQHWESNPRLSDLESNVLSTWPHAPTNIQVHLMFSQDDTIWNYEKWPTCFRMYGDG